MKYYDKVISVVGDNCQTIGASIAHNNNIVVELKDATTLESCDTNDPLATVTAVSLNKAQATTLMYHLQYLISLSPLIDA